MRRTRKGGTNMFKKVCCKTLTVLLSCALLATVLTAIPAPTMAAGGGVAAVAGGWWHSLAIKNDGTLWAWGYNYYGQLGDGTGQNKSKPVQITLGGSAPDDPPPVEPPNTPVSVTVSPKKVTLIVGETKMLQAKVTPSDASQEVTWKSSNSGVASVSSDGTISGVAAGKTTITATTSNGKKASCAVTVKEPIKVKSVKLSKKAVTINSSFILKSVVKPENASNRSLTWSSSNEDIVKVGDNGELTPVKRGRAIVEARANDGSGISAKCNVTVGRSNAVVVGSSDCRAHGLKRSSAFRNSINMMEEMLKKQKNYGQPFKILKRDGPSAWDIRALINKAFAGSTKFDINLFYMVTHGGNDGDLLLENGLTLPIVQLKEYLDKHDGIKVVILNSCFSGSAIYKPENNMEQINRRIINVFRDNPATAKAGEMATDGYMVITSCAYNEVSAHMNWPGKLGYTFFTRALTEITASNRDEWDTEKADGNAALQEVFDYTYSKSREYTRRWTAFTLPTVQGFGLMEFILFRFGDVFESD